MDLNKAQIIGRLTRDPESKTIGSGQMVTTFSVATGRQWTDKQTGEKKEQTEFHNVVAWRRLAEIAAEYLKKGRQVYIEGHLQTRSWDDPSGVKKYRTEIVADELIMLGGRDGGGGAPAQSSAPAAAAPAQAEQLPTIQVEEQSAPPTPQASGDGADTISVEDIPF